MKIKRIDNPRIQIVKCVGTLMMKITIKTNNGPNFHYKKLSVIELVLTDRIIQVNGQNRPMANLPVVDFRLQPREMPLLKPLNT